MRFGMLSTSLSHCSWMTLFQAWCKNSSCWAWVDGLWPSSFLLITFQRFSRGFGPGVWAGHVRVLIWWSSIHSLIGQAEWLEPCPTLKKQSSAFGGIVRTEGNQFWPKITLYVASVTRRSRRWICPIQALLKHPQIITNPWPNFTSNPTTGHPMVS